MLLQTSKNDVIYGRDRLGGWVRGHPERSLPSETVYRSGAFGNCIFIVKIAMIVANYVGQDRF